MKLLGFEITRAKRPQQAAPVTGTAVSTGGGGWYSIIREAWSGMWQGNLVLDDQRNLLAFSAVFACVTIIANDIAKLCVRLMEKDSEGVGEPVQEDTPITKLLKRPNHYQTWIKFFTYWVISKLLYGNTYVLKERKGGTVQALYVLDPQRVSVVVATDGSVYYRLSRDDLSGLTDAVAVPASEIIHDLMNPLWHPLVGVSPVYACGLSATMGNKIQRNSSKFFENMSRPSGMLTSAGSISDETAGRMKKDWEENFSGGNIGRLAVLGDGLKYEPMTIPAEQAQLIEQLKWTVEDVARCFHVPLYKLGAAVPTGLNVAALNQSYYDECLQIHIESAEEALDDGLGLDTGQYIEFDIDGLVRMDPATRYEAYGKGVNGGWMHPNFARLKEGMRPVAGGDTPYLQQQNFSLEALAKRDAKEDPFGKYTGPASPDTGTPAADSSMALQEFAEKFSSRLEASNV